MGADHVSYCMKDECCMPELHTNVDTEHPRKLYKCIARNTEYEACPSIANNWYESNKYSRCIKDNTTQKKQVELLPGDLTKAGEAANLVAPPRKPAVGITIPN